MFCPGVRGMWAARRTIIDHPWKIVPGSLMVFQLRRMLGLGEPGFATFGHTGIPVNLFDAIRMCCENR
jgi:hypothetical protein